jgi:hypothetical protein
MSIYSVALFRQGADSLAVKDFIPQVLMTQLEQGNHDRCYEVTHKPGVFKSSAFSGSFYPNPHHSCDTSL